MPTLPTTRCRSSLTKDRKLIASVLGAAIFHGGLLASGSYRDTYDAYVHIFFADHYRRNWFSTWEPRWYTGFPVTGYPPGSHQLIALLSRLTGLRAAFAIVQLAAIILLVVGVYRFSKLWVSRDAAGWAALACVASSSMAEVVHVFGQLPTTLSLGLLLNSQPSIHKWVSRGGLPNLGCALALLAATTASHHVTTLFGSIFFTSPVVAQALLDRWRQPITGETGGHPAMVNRTTFLFLARRRLHRVARPFGRTIALGFSTLLVLILVVLPYWIWTSSDPITQVPIPHGSRSNFFEDRSAGLAFFVIPWASCLFALPVVLRRVTRLRQWPLAWSVCALALLGTGGTTPIPRILLGNAFEILTLDRFTIWATIAILPFAGDTLNSLVQRSSVQRSSLPSKSALAGVAALSITSTIFASAFGQFRTLQPDPIDPDPTVEFLAKDDHDRWRYLTLGFGDQMAWLSANTTALTVDGNYHSARRLPELTSRAVERLEGAKFTGIAGIGSLQQFLGFPSRYHLKFVFCADEFYEPLLWASGWHRLGLLDNGVMVWEKADVPPLPGLLLTREIPGWQRLLWGIAPLMALGSAVAAMVFLCLPTIPGSADSGHPAIDRPDPGAHRLRKTRVGRKSSPTRASGLLAAIACTSLLGGLLGHTRSSPRSNSSTTNEAAASQSAASEIKALLLEYYDHLDFRRFSRAYVLLNPQTRPSQGVWDLERSVQDGLLHGYAKLDSISILNIELNPANGSEQSQVALATVSLQYLTSLSEIQVSAQHSLTMVNSQWRLEPEQRRFEIPPEPFASRVQVNYLAQGRRQVTDGRTALWDVLDRPRIAINEGKLVHHNGRWSVVGSVTNLDVDPADVTIDATLLDSDNLVLAEYSATIFTVHKVLPGERVPFRIDMEGRFGEVATSHAGAGFSLDPRFSPDAFSKPVFSAEIAEVVLAARAVVTQHNLDRSLSLQQVKTTKAADGTIELSGQVHNDGTQTATIPHLLVSLIDSQGKVGWVDDLWLQDGVRAQRSQGFILSLTSLSSVQTLDVPISFYASGQDHRPPGSALESSAPDKAALDDPVSNGLILDSPGWSRADLNVVSFMRSEQR